MTPLTARYYKADGQAGVARALPTELFDGVVHESAIHAAVKAHLANRRQGTASAKNRGVMRGGGRKPWRQKGTGRARVGSIRSPIWRGGAVVFPPQPRSYREHLPKKVRHLARHSAFNARASEDRVIVIESLAVEQPKTRQLVRLLEKLGLTDDKVLILTAGYQPSLYLSARNIPDVEVRAFGRESAYDVLWADSVVIEEQALSESRQAGDASVPDASSEEGDDA
ncbi:MAG: 50S ribosomal protein L4 [Gemmatimonadota bacterium]|nr:MAG: 50S ribosomal protein L4 [Gemmatimonadota bacterium]